MRKITLFLALMLTCVGTAMAQWSGKGIASISETAATTLTDGYYVIYNNGRGTFMNSEGALGQAKVTWPTTANATGVAALASSEALNNAQGATNKMAYVFYVNVEGSTMSLKTGYEDYVPVLTTNATFNYVADEAFWNYEVVEGGFVFLKGETVGLDCNGWSASSHTYSTVAGWDADGSKNTSGNQSWSFYAVELEDVTEVNVTYNYQLNGVTKKEVTIVQNVGDAYAAPVIDYVTFTQPEGVVPAGGAVVNVACEENLPFIASSSIANATWQVIDMHSNENNYTWKYVAEDANVELPVIAKAQSASLGDNYYWAFVGNVFDGFKIYNKAAGATLTLRKAENGNTVSVMSATDDRNVFKLSASTSSIANAFCFNIEGDSYYVNTQNVDGTKILKGWTAKDEGSSCRIFTPASFVLNTIEGEVSAPVGAVGSYTYFADAEKSAQVVAAIAPLQANPYDIEALETLDASNIISNVLASEQVPYVDGYYRIYSAQSGLYANNKGLIYNVAGSVDNPFRWGTVEETNVDAIVRLTTDNEKIVLQAVNTGNYMQGVGGASAATTSENGHFTLTELGSAQYNLVFGNGTMHANGHGSGAGSEGNVIDWDGAMGSASAWYLVPAKNFKVTLTPVDDASYATGYYPFPVSVTGNTTLNVGTLNADKDKLGLTSVEGVPANTGVVIVNSAAEATATLAIGGEYSVSSNALTGSCTAITENISDYLVLGVGATSGVLGFYETTATEIPANKAFLAAGSLSAVKLDLGGDVTAIENVELGNANAPIFDLSGRRVLTPIKGGVYIQGGKKFIVK